MKISLIISVYKDIQSLRTILEALKFQTFKVFEIIVSEDGDSIEMKNFLDNYKHPNLIIHSTQSDRGWRKNRALNKAIQKSNGDYLIFIDGDCVPHHEFIKNHVLFSNENTILAGRRVKLGPQYSQIFKDQINQLLILEKKVIKDYFGMHKDGAKFYEEGIYIEPNSFLGKILQNRKFRTIKGCNMSFYKKDIVNINGFDEDYTLPAIGEDIDLIWRFKLAGFSFDSVKNFAVQYHLHHKENWSDNLHNETIMQEKMSRQEFICKNGIKKYF